MRLGRFLTVHQAGIQRRLVEGVVATGTPTVMIVLSGRPYAIGWAIEQDGAPRAVVQAFFPGEEGASAITGVVSGRVSPSGRLPVSLPRSAGAQPFSYLHPILGGPTEITSADSTPVLPFGHGLTYTSFVHANLSAPETAPTSRSLTVQVTVRNTGERRGDDVVQLYARDVYASVTRPVAQLVAYRRLGLDAGEEAVVTFEIPPSRFSFTDAAFQRVVEPGDIELWVGSSCENRETQASVRLTGEVHRVTPEEPRVVAVSVKITQQITVSERISSGATAQPA